MGIRMLEMPAFLGGIATNFCAILANVDLTKLQLEMPALLRGIATINNYVSHLYTLRLNN